MRRGGGGEEERGRRRGEMERGDGEERWRGGMVGMWVDRGYE